MTGKVVMPEIPAGFTMVFRGADIEQVISMAQSILDLCTKIRDAQKEPAQNCNLNEAKAIILEFVLMPTDPITVASTSGEGVVNQPFALSVQLSADHSQGLSTKLGSFTYPLAVTAISQVCGSPTPRPDLPPIVRKFIQWDFDSQRKPGQTQVPIIGSYYARNLLGVEFVMVDKPDLQRTRNNFDSPPSKTRDRDGKGTAEKKLIKCESDFSNDSFYDFDSDGSIERAGLLDKRKKSTPNFNSEEEKFTFKKLKLYKITNNIIDYLEVLGFFECDSIDKDSFRNLTAKAADAALPVHVYYVKRILYRVSVLNKLVYDNSNTPFIEKKKAQDEAAQKVISAAMRLTKEVDIPHFSKTFGSTAYIKKLTDRAEVELRPISHPVQNNKVQPEFLPPYPQNHFDNQAYGGRAPNQQALMSGANFQQRPQCLACFPDPTQPSKLLAAQHHTCQAQVTVPSSSTSLIHGNPKLDRNSNTR